MFHGEPRAHGIAEVQASFGCELGAVASVQHTHGVPFPLWPVPLSATRPAECYAVSGVACGQRSAARNPVTGSSPGSLRSPAPGSDGASPDPPLGA